MPSNVQKDKRALCCCFERVYGFVCVWEWGEEVISLSSTVSNSLLIGIELTF